jgi:hypothetical protein
MGERWKSKLPEATLGISNCIQDPDRNDTVPTGLWQNLPFASWTWVQIPLGDQEVKYGSPISWSQETNPSSWIGRMEGEGLPQLQALKLANEVMAW